MSLPLGHACVGGSISVALWPQQTPAGLKRALWVGALLSVLPDVDIVLGRMRMFGVGWHHGFTHSIAFAVIMGVSAARLAAPGWRGTLACVLAALSHLVLDYVVTETAGLELWWPVTAQRYKLGITALTYYRIAPAFQPALAYAKVLAAEFVLFAPLLALTLFVRWRGLRKRR